jgi:hypothetical protein
MPTSSCAKKRLGKDPIVRKKQFQLTCYSVKAGAAHIAFTAPSRSTVRDFYAAALNAGGRPNGAPSSRSDEDGHFNAAVLDLDGNSIEVVFRNGPDIRDDGTVVEHSRVITWQRTVSESFHDGRSVVSSRTAHSSSRQDIMPVLAQAVSKAPSAVSTAPSTASKPASVARSVSAPVATLQTSTATEANDGAGAKTLIGTLLGAAAGAAVAYAMVRSEQDSAKKEAEFKAFKKAQAAVTQLAQVRDEPQLSMQDPQQIYESRPSPPHRNISETDSQYSSPQARNVYAPRAIEPAPPSYYSPSYTSAAPTQVGGQRAIEYRPASSVGLTRSQYVSPHRSITSPELLMIEKARSTVSRVHSVAPSTLISSFVPDQIERRDSEGSVASHHSSRSKSKSSHTHASRHSSRRTESRSRASSPPPSKGPSKASSLVSSILGRDNKSTVSSLKDPFTDAFEVEDTDDCDTVAPSDSISNAGSSSRRSHRSHRSSSKRSDEDSVASSRHSSTSKHSKSSKHSSRSHKSHSSRSRHSEYHSADENPRLPSIISEPSDASTVKPIKVSKSRSGASESGSRSGKRKDSVTHGQYDSGVEYGEVPIRGITPSMIGGGKDENKTRTMVSYAHMQKVKAFEQ